MSTPLDSALEAALAAGDVLRAKFPHAREVKSKGWRDIVTDADLAAQHAIADVLISRFPDFALLSEEGHHEVDLTAPAPTWVIDPLDGTTNYARQFPSFGVSIALAHRGEIQLGVIHDPLRRDTFFAERGQGAFIQNEQGERQPMRASDLSDMGGALVGVDWPRDPALRQRVVEAIGRVAAECRTVRAVGSAALGLAYVAAGWLDGYYHLALQPWDVAAGALIVTEAGGQISAPDGSAWRLGMSQIVASNGVLHETLVRALALY
jgi:myo-inositol-1(or 4)-monophosphatase